MSLIGIIVILSPLTFSMRRFLRSCRRGRSQPV